MFHGGHKTCCSILQLEFNILAIFTACKSILVELQSQTMTLFLKKKTWAI